jgi:hypothetical protein
VWKSVEALLFARSSHLGAVNEMTIIFKKEKGRGGYLKVVLMSPVPLFFSNLFFI